ALKESTARNVADFSYVTEAQEVPNPNKLVYIPVEIHEEMNQTFKESKLDNPITLDQLEIPTNSKWVGVKAKVETYKPGSKIFFTVTTQPIVFGEATVNRDGTAEISGALPLSILESGAHTIRVVGIRIIEGIGADDQGEITISEEAMTEIQRFDDGTKATIKFFGKNSKGGVNSAYREVPLDLIIPWWTLWIVGLSALFVMGLRRYRKLDSKADKLIAAATLFVSSLPALWLGWTGFAYIVMGLGALIFVAGSVLIWFIPEQKKSKKA
ncbi:MAG: hypothetical protein RIS18_731, partial [Actinomycetota bacterium]